MTLSELLPHRSVIHPISIVRFRLPKFWESESQDERRVEIGKEKEAELLTPLPNFLQLRQNLRRQRALQLRPPLV